MQSVKNKAYLAPVGTIMKSSHNSMLNKRLQITRLQMSMRVSTEQSRAEQSCGIHDGAISIGYLNTLSIHKNIQRYKEAKAGEGEKERKVDGMSKPGILIC